MILGSDTRARWSKWDILLVQAFHMLEKERCQLCGNPRYVCQNESNDIHFVVTEETCHATRAKEAYEERAREQRSKRKDAKEPSGVTMIVEPHTYSRRELTVFRDSFYEKQHQRREDRLESFPVIPADD